MNKFIAELDKRDLTYVLEDNYRPYSLPKAGLVRKFFQEIIDQKGSVYIHYDRDTDGALSGKIIQLLFEKLGYSNYVLPIYSYKSHNIESKELFDIVSGAYSHVIIVDSSSNDFDMHSRLTSAGMKVLVIDHHELVDEDYKYDDILLINNKLKEFEATGQYLNVSAGMLCYFVAKEVLESIPLKEGVEQPTTDDLMHLAYVTMYSDMMDMSDRDNIGFAQRVMNLHSPIPKLLLAFKSDYYAFSKDFVSLNFANRINSLVKTENFQLLYEVIFNFEKKSGLEVQMLVAQVEDICARSSKIANDLLEYKDINHSGRFIVVDLTKACEILKINTRVAANYTGTVANKLSAQYKMPCLTFVMHDRMYRGSIRDMGNAKLLNQMSYFMNADGHASAFGVKFSPLNKSLVLDYLAGVTYEEDKVEPIVMSAESMDILTLKKVIQTMSIYNEYSGGKLPVAVITKCVGINNNISQTKKVSVISHADLQILCFDTSVSVGSKLKIAPKLGVNSPKLIAERLTS